MYPSLNPHTIVGSDLIHNAPNLNMNNAYLNAYTGTSAERTAELYTSQPQLQPSSNTFGEAFLYSGSIPQGSSSQHMPSAAALPSSVFSIPLQAIPRNVNRPFSDDHNSGCAYAHGMAPYSLRENYKAPFHMYSNNPISQPIQRMSTAGAPVMPGYSHDHVTFARLSSASSLSTRTSAPGENGAGPIVIPSTSLPHYHSSSHHCSSHPSSRNSRVEDRIFAAPDNVMIPPPSSQEPRYNGHQIVSSHVGTAASPTVASSSTQTLTLPVMSNTPFIWTSLHPDLATTSVSGSHAHGINAVAPSGTDATALPSLSFPLMRSFGQSTINKLQATQNNHDSDCGNVMGGMSALLNEKSCESQVMLANPQQCSETCLAQEREIAADEGIFVRISAIERTLMELFEWGRAALSPSCLSFSNLPGCGGDENAATSQDVGVVVQTQAGQVEMDLQVSSYLVERLEYAEEQLSPLDAILHKLFHKYIISDGSSILSNNKMTTAPTPSGLPKMAASQLVACGEQERSNLFIHPEEARPIADSSSDPTIALASTVATHFTGVAGLNLTSCMSEEFSKQCESIRQLLLDDILLRQPITRSSQDILNPFKDASGFPYNSRANLSGSGLSTVDSSHTCHRKDGDQSLHESLPLRLIMIPAEGNDDGRPSSARRTSSKVTGLDSSHQEERAQQSNLASSIAEKVSPRSSGRNTVSSSTILLDSSSHRGSEHCVVFVATPMRYAQHQLFLIVNTAVEHLHHVLHLGQLRNQKELQKVSERTQPSPTIAMTNTAPDEALLLTRITLQKDAEMLRMWTNRVEALQKRLHWIKQKIDTAVKVHASVRRQVLEILNQRLNNEEGERNGDDDDAQRSCNSEASGVPRGTEGESDRPDGSTVAFRKTSSPCQPEGTCPVNSNDAGTSTNVEVMEIPLEADSLSCSESLRETFRLHDLPNVPDAHPRLLDTVSSESQPQQLCRVDNDPSHKLSLCMENEKELQPTHDTQVNDFGQCTNSFFDEKVSRVAPGESDPSAMARSGDETENLSLPESHEGYNSNLPTTNGPMGTAEHYSPHGSGWEHTSQCRMSCQDEGVAPTHQAPLSLPHDAGCASCSDSTYIASSNGGTLVGSEDYRDHKVFYECHPQSDCRAREQTKISRLRSSENSKRRVGGKASRDAFLSPTEPRTRAGSVCESDNSDDEGPIEYSLRSPNNLFRGFKAFLKAVVRRATSFDSEDDDESSENRQKRQRRC